MKTLISTPIPTEVLQRITDSIKFEYPELDEKSRTKLLSRLVELWWLIKDAHIKELSKISDYETSNLEYRYTNISSRTLSKFEIQINKKIKVNTLLLMLEQARVIDINNIYSVGNFTKSYRPTPELDYLHTFNIPIDFSKIIDSYSSEEQLIAKNDPKYTKLIKDLYKTRIDLTSFFLVMDSITNTIYKKVKGVEKIMTPDLAYDYKMRAIKINLGLHFFSVSSTGRCYTSIANLPTITLKYLTVDGRNMIDIDLNNSQPLNLSVLIDNPQYKKDCESGVFYDKVAAHLNITRDEFKLKSYETIFFNKDKVTGLTADNLEVVYPGIVRQINALKDKEELWFLLQKMEADLWISTALEISNTILTRHDSVMIFPEDLQSFKDSITAKYKKLGASITLKETRF